MEDRAHTRRTLIVGAGGAAVGLASGGLSTPQSAPAAEAPKPPFDIRDQVDGAAADPPQVQCYYDTINRSVLLAGDIRFRSLFGAPMSRLVPRIDQRVDFVAQFGLVPDPAALHSLLGQLLELAPKWSMTDFFATTRRKVPVAVQRTLVALRGQGLPAPLPTTARRDAQRRLRAARRLRREVGDATLLSYFTEPVTAMSDEQLGAIAGAKDVSLIVCGKNDRCCKTVRWLDRKKTVPLEQKCLPLQDSDCFISQSPVTRGLCTAVSDPCPDDS